MSDGDDLDLASLPDDELVTQMHEDLYDGMAPEIAEGTLLLLDRGWSPDKVLNDALVEGMRIVGIDFRDGILFVPEVLLSANAMKAGMEILRPLLAETGAEPIGKVVIGTVKGDIHDIGKNIVCTLLENHGFEVFDIGKNVSAATIIAKAKEFSVHAVGLSALMTTTMSEMDNVIKKLRAAGVKTFTMVGGAVVTQEYADRIGADLYARDAMEAVARIKQLLSVAD